VSDVWDPCEEGGDSQLSFCRRPLQIVQWTMAGVPGHPIYLDAIRRVVEAMQDVKEWDHERKTKASTLLDKLTKDKSTLRDRKKVFSNDDWYNDFKSLLNTDPFDTEHGGRMSLIEATGPGAFSDSVLSYLQARYDIHWSQLHNIQTATRIGEVAILPITGFAPFLKPDWQRWKGIDRGPMSVVGDITHPQAMVNHRVSDIRKEQVGSS
jgi:alpha 1,6-mannosyltransferase